jgi:hypothetical protein
MPRTGASAILLALVGLVVLACVAPAALADDRDPRCADWERHGAPPGTNMAVQCPDSGALIDGVALSDEPLVPYIVGLLVTAGVLTAFGLVATRVLARPAARETPIAWWSCPACGTSNGPDRSSCFACHEPRTTDAQPVQPARP